MNDLYGIEVDSLIQICCSRDKLGTCKPYPWQRER